jgi:hypothetical protein
MRTAFLFGLLAAFIAAPPASSHAQSNEVAVDTAKQAAQEWLVLFEDEKYEATWAEASAYFKSKIGEEQWVARIQQMKTRRPVLDSLRSRSLVAARYTTSLPRAPNGEYVVVQYKAMYADEPWVETVTLKKDPDGWRVAGYLTRPQP